MHRHTAQLLQPRPCAPAAEVAFQQRNDTNLGLTRAKKTEKNDPVTWGQEAEKYGRGEDSVWSTVFTVEPHAEYHTERITIGTQQTPLSEHRDLKNLLRQPGRLLAPTCKEAKFRPG